MAGWARSYEAPAFWVVRAGSEVVGAAMITPPFDLVLSGCRPAVARELAAFIARGRSAVPGVTGTREPADEFAAAWESLTGLRAAMWRREQIYELREVKPPEGVSGTARPACAADLELLADWLATFAELTGEPIDALAVAADVIADDRALLWLDPDPVSVAITGRKTRTGASIGPVFTPSDRRGHGYASAVTAALSSRLLAAGRRFCCLYTDLANPTSNRIYRRIGYLPVVDVNHYRFTNG
jgi:hypothetical protein